MRSAVAAGLRNVDEARGHGAHQMRISTTSNFKPGDCFAKPVHEADTPPSDWPATTISISSIPNTPGGPGAIRLADMAALNRSPSWVQFPMVEHRVSPPPSLPLGPNSTTPAPSPTGVLNQTEYLP